MVIHTSICPPLRLCPARKIARTCVVCGYYAHGYKSSVKRANSGSSTRSLDLPRLGFLGSSLTEAHMTPDSPLRPLGSPSHCSCPSAFGVSTSLHANDGAADASTICISAARGLSSLPSLPVPIKEALLREPFPCCTSRTRRSALGCVPIT